MTQTLTAAAVEPGPNLVKLDQLICWWSIPIFYQFFGLIFGYLTKIMGPPIPGPNLTLEELPRSPWEMPDTCRSA